MRETPFSGGASISRGRNGAPTAADDTPAAASVARLLAHWEILDDHHRPRNYRPAWLRSPPSPPPTLPLPARAAHPDLHAFRVPRRRPALPMRLGAVRAHEQPLRAAARTESPAASRSSPARAMPGIVGCGQTLWREGYRARAGCSSHARVGRSTARCLRIKRLAYRHRQASTSYRLAALAIQHGVQRGLPSSSGTATHLQKGSAPATTSRLAPSASRRSERQPSL